MKPGKNKDELCYPFIYETSYLCDFEIATDELCNHVGLVLSLLPDDFSEIKTDLEYLHPLVYHLNGSIRGKLAIKEKDQQWLLARYHYYQQLTMGIVKGFVLPRGPQPVPQLHLARSATKKAIRLMVRIEEDGTIIPDIIPRFCNLLCNFFFVLTIYLNHKKGIKEIPFNSKSYTNISL